MDSGLILLGLLGILYGLMILIGLPVLLLGQRGLKDRIARLEAEIARIASASAAPQPDMPAAPETATAPEKEPALALPRQDAAERMTEQPPPAPRPDPIAPPSRSYVLRAENVARLGAWLRANWTLAIAALSLVLGGLFMVQYGVERGLLTPPMRVLGALALGAALVAGGEWLRRRHGDVETPTIRHLPSTLAGAGVVVLFIGLLSANALYGLIGAGAALSGVALVAAGAVVLGWLYGPVLPAVGLLGAGVAPFLVAASDVDATPLYGYFAILGLAGLAIDSLRRWAWVSALALSVATLGLLAVHADAAFAPGFIGAAFVLAAGALILPERQLQPVQTGAPLWQPRRGARPAFPTLLGAAGIAIATGAATLVALDRTGSPADAGLGLAALAGLFVAIALWLYRAPALDSAIALPTAGFLAALAAQPILGTALFSGFDSYRLAPPETDMPTTLWWVMAAAATMAAAAFWRLHRTLRTRTEAPPEASLLWAMISAAILPATALTLEFLWQPRMVIGNAPWAMAAMVSAAVLVLMAERRARLGGPTRARDTGLFAAAATLMIALAFFLLLSKAALTLGLALLMVLASAVDRRFALPALAWIAQLGAAVIGYRLLVDPGLDHSLHVASWSEFLLGHLGALAGFEATRRLARAERGALRAVAESALLTTAALIAMLALARAIGTQDAFSTHWMQGLSATIWAGSALGQMWRLAASASLLRRLRAVFAAISGGVALVFALRLSTTTSEMLTFEWADRVLGPPIFDSLTLAFLPLAATLGVGSWALGQPGRPLARMLRPVLGASAALFVLLWGFVEIRRLWRGPELWQPGPSDGELYSYTVAMLALSLGLLAMAVLRRSGWMRRAAMTGVALTIAKVFLIDMSGLSGLTRVVSFVGLGLALAGLAWINRKIDGFWGAAERPKAPAPPPGTTPDT
jgi:uncharacterized membrane protein